MRAAGLATVMLNKVELVVCESESATVITILTVLLIVGVPLITPVVRFRFKPLCSVPVFTVYVYGGIPGYAGSTDTGVNDAVAFLVIVEGCVVIKYNGGGSTTDSWKVALDD